MYKLRKFYLWPKSFLLGLDPFFRIDVYKNGNLGNTTKFIDNFVTKNKNGKSQGEWKEPFMEAKPHVNNNDSSE